VTTTPTLLPNVKHLPHRWEQVRRPSLRPCAHRPLSFALLSWIHGEPKKSSTRRRRRRWRRQSRGSDPGKRACV